MKLTQEQETVLQTFHIDRLTDSASDSRAIENFETKERGANLLAYLQNSNCALKDNADLTNAVFFIRDGDGDVLLYFTLKCGSLHRHYSASILELADKLEEYDNLSNLANKGDENAKWALEDRMPVLQEAINIYNVLKKKGTKFVKKLRSLLSNRANETNANNMNVLLSHPGIEMAQFCVNEACKPKYKDLFSPNTIGATVFWYKIIPFILTITDCVGLEYLYIFAADNTPNKQLVGYYNTALCFAEPEDIGTVRPLYDNNCILMSQKVSDLLENRKRFFDNFNPDGDEA